MVIAITFNNLYVLVAFSCLVLGIWLSWSLGLEGITTIPDEGNIFKLYMCVYMLNYVYCSFVVVVWGK